MPTQEQVAQDLCDYLNRSSGNRWIIEECPDQNDPRRSTRPLWDYTLRNELSGQRRGLEVTSSRRSSDAGQIDATWSEMVLKEVRGRVQSEVSGNFLIYTPERIEATRRTRAQVAREVSEAIICLCRSGQDSCEVTVQTVHSPVAIRVRRNACPDGNVGFMRIPAHESYVGTMSSELERILLQKERQLQAIIDDGFPPYIIIWNENYALVDPTDVARAAHEIIRRQSLRWVGAYVWGAGMIFTINPAVAGEAGVTWDRS